MTKAEEKAIETYPDAQPYDSYTIGKRIGYRKGYAQAEKDFLDAVHSIEMEVKEGGMFPTADSIPVLSNCDMILLPKDKFKVGDKIIVQIRKNN